MGVTYDRDAGCWRLDYPFRTNGKPRHLRQTVYGPKRQTQGEAMQIWLELQERTQDPQGSLTFGDDINTYLADHSDIAANILGTIEHIRRGIGKYRHNDLQDAGKQWLIAEERRISDKTGKRLSPATIQAYKRYIKAILGHCHHKTYWPEIPIGGTIARRRPFEPWEMLALEEVIGNDFSWFYPAFDFARCCPIRPEDQFALTAANVQHDPFGVKYQARKTKTTAYPIINEQQVKYFTCKSGLIFSRPGGESMYAGVGNAYYGYIWEKACNKAGVKGATFYDLRHNAVGYLRSLGIEDWRIVKAAGWTGPEMLKIYDPDNEHLIREYDLRVSTKSSLNVVLK